MKEKAIHQMKAKQSPSFDWACSLSSSLFFCWLWAGGPSSAAKLNQSISLFIQLISLLCFALCCSWREEKIRLIDWINKDNWMGELNEIEWLWAGQPTYNFSFRNLKIFDFQWRKQLNFIHSIHQLTQRNSIKLNFFFVSLINWIHSIDWWNKKVL